jgi:hypothetical protein
MVVALLRNLLLGVEQFAQKLSSQRYIAGEHDPFNDSEGVARAGDDLGTAVAHVILALAHAVPATAGASGRAAYSGADILASSTGPTTIVLDAHRPPQLAPRPVRPARGLARPLRPRNQVRKDGS